LEREQGVYSTKNNSSTTLVRRDWEAYFGKIIPQKFTENGTRFRYDTSKSPMVAIAANHRPMDHKTRAPLAAIQMAILAYRSASKISEPTMRVAKCWLSVRSAYPPFTRSETNKVVKTVQDREVLT
jgi:hypothetical protein